MKMFRNVADIAICLISIITFWFMWPLSLLRKSLGLHFIHFIVVFILAGLFLVHIFWNYERFCNYSRAGFLSPADGEIVKISKITQANGEEYHVISISQRTFGARAFFAPLDGTITQVPSLSEQDGSIEVKLPGILRKVFGEQAVFSRRITIKSQDTLGNKCFVSALCTIGIPFVSVANDNFKAGTIFGSSNFCPLGALVNYYIPVGKSGSLVCVVGQTVIGGETTLVEKVRPDAASKSKLAGDQSVMAASESKVRPDAASKSKLAGDQSVMAASESKVHPDAASKSKVHPTNPSEESKNEVVASSSNSEVAIFPSGQESLTAPQKSNVVSDGKLVRKK